MCLAPACFVSPQTNATPSHGQILTSPLRLEVWSVSGSYFVLSMFDRLWRKDLSEEEALELMEKGVAEVKSRLVVAPPTFIVKIIDKNGIRTIKSL